MNALIILIVLFVMALADFTRGSGNRPKWAPKAACLFVIGLAVAFLLGLPAGLSAAGVASFIAIGGSVGMGNALGPAIHGEQPQPLFAEWWQKGPLLKNTWLSLGALGFLWGAPVLLALPFVASAWAPVVAFTIATPFAAWLAVSSVGGKVRRVDGHDPDFDRETKRSNLAWSTFNTIRSPLAGLAIVALTLIPIPSFAGPLDETRFCGPPDRNAKGDIIRRADVLKAFEKSTPCPGPVGTTCPGWRRDHVWPLACGGCDSVSNLQWLTVSAWKDKSLWERRVYGGRGISEGCP